MQLDYLLFDYTDEESGAGSFDAMASVLPERLPALIGEIEAVLRSAYDAFGPPGEDSEWQFELQGATDAEGPLTVTYDAEAGTVSLAPVRDDRTTLALTIGGSQAFCEAFRDAFDVSDS